MQQDISEWFGLSYSKFSYLLWGEERLEIAADRITNPDGTTLVEDPELAELIVHGEEAFQAWLDKQNGDSQ